MMKVTGKMPSSVQSGEAAKSARTSGADSIFDSKKTRGNRGAEVGSADSARVDLSSRAQDMVRAKELATPNEGIDEAKVARLQKLIDAGKYKVDAEAIADRLVDEHSKMP
jgi:negative regulator of flagellin synthesis FlgM